MLFSTLCEYFEKIEATSSRLSKTDLLVQLIEECDEAEVGQAVNMALGQLRPKYDRLEFNMADRMVVRAIGVASRKPISEVEAEYKQVGDMGEVAGEINAQKQKSTNVKVGDVFEELEKIAGDSGTGSQERKVSHLAKILAVMSGQEAKYTVRMVLGKLRLGFSDKTILDTLSTLDTGSKEARKELDALYQVAPDVAELATQVKMVGIEEAGKRIGIKLGRPVIPALAQRLPSAVTMIEKMGKVIAEPKLDGTRVQIHFSKNEFGNTKSETRNQKQNGLFGEEKKQEGWVRTFTRDLDENSHMFPELQEMGTQVKAKEIILDCEAVGYDPKTGKMVPFQMTITRKRKHGVGEASIAVPLKFYVFDILYLDGESLIEKPLQTRREILKKVIQGTGPLVVDESIVTEDAEILREYHTKKLSEGYEGVVVKKLDGAYMPGRQGYNWVKLKEEEGQEGKLLDTIDVVVMGYYKGKGKRTGFGIGAFLVGIALDNEKILTIAKVGTGLTDEQFRELNAKLKNCTSAKMPEGYVVEKMLVPDVWTEPKVIVEVAADEVTVSPTHSSGYALRFPRLVKFRDDKDIDGVTTVDELKVIAGII